MLHKTDVVSCPDPHGDIPAVNRIVTSAGLHDKAEVVLVDVSSDFIPDIVQRFGVSIHELRIRAVHPRLLD